MIAIRSVFVSAVLLTVCSVLLSSCSSVEKKPIAKVESLSTAPSKSTLSSDDIVQKYSLTELNSVANALRAVADAGINKSGEDEGSEIFGCAMTRRESMAMAIPIRSVINAALRSEREAYVLNPKIYSNEKGFESCAGSCSCGVYSEIVESIDESSLPHGSLKQHSRNQQRLKAKASRQSAANSLACAKTATWFCGSDLKAYLEKESRQNGE